VDAEGELIDGGLLSSQVEDSDLGIWHTSTETTLRVRLVLAVAVTTGWSTPHLEFTLKNNSNNKLIDYIYHVIKF
jgi:hypothetical protein